MAEKNTNLNKLEQLRRNEQFKVPEGYFDTLPGRILDRIRESETSHEASQYKTHKIVQWRKFVAVAASVAAIVVLSFTMIRVFLNSESNKELSEPELIAFIENEIMSFDDTELYDLTQTAQQIPANAEIKLTREEILEYLSQEGSDFDLSDLEF